MFILDVKTHDVNARASHGVNFIDAHVGKFYELLQLACVYCSLSMKTGRS